jgi:putative membrane protein
MKSLSEAGRTKIEATIADIEQRTAAELVVATVEQSGSYSEVKLGYALAAALGGAAVLHLCVPELPVAYLLWLQLAAASATWLLCSWPWLLGRVVPRAYLTQSVEQRAQLAFLEHALFETRDRTGVLILISELEHRVVILGDSGIHGKVQTAGWQSHIGHIVEAIRKGRAEDGICETLRAIGEVLIAEFPPRPDDVNELDNAVRQTRR